MSTHTLPTGTLNTPYILHEVRARRNGENLANAFKLIAILLLALLAAWIAMILAAPHRVAEISGFIAVLVFFLVFGTFHLLINFLFVVFPFLLYFWANVQTVRQRTLLTLIQTAVETEKPLQDIVRAYAANCFFWYAARLRRFADALDSGFSLEAAVRQHWGLFRYDVASMIRLGGNAVETLRSIETVAHDERDFAPIRGMTIIRIIYLCNIVLSMIPILAFLFSKIVPEFEKMFLEFGTPLPALTAAVVHFSQYFVMFWYLFFPLFFPLASLFFFAVICYLILQTNVVVFRPIGLRRMFRYTDSAKFLMVFAVGMRQRYPLPVIMRMYRWTVPSDYLRKKGADIHAAIEKGNDWIEAVRQAGFISAPEASLLQSAQRTGNTPAVLDQLALSKERLQIRKDDLLSKMVFIPLIFLLAAVVGTSVVALFLPLIALITALS